MPQLKLNSACFAGSQECDGTGFRRLRRFSPRISQMVRRSTLQRVPVLINLINMCAIRVKSARSARNLSPRLSGLGLRKLALLLTALLSLGCLMALSLDIPGPDDKVWEIEQLRAQQLGSFNTIRVKGIEKVEDNWQGLELIPWLEAQTDYVWHELEFVSVDAHSLRMSRLDLESKPVWLALKDSQGWLQEGIRLVFPGQRDNIWIRGLDKIVLHGFTPLPAPRRIYSWEDVNLPQDESGISSVTDLVSSFFAESQGDLLILSKDGTPLRLKYPDHLNEAQLVWKDGTLAIQPEALLLPGMPNSLIYLQMGHQAILTPEGVRLLPDLARALQWPESPGWKAVRPLYEKYEPGTRIPTDGWLERD